MYHTDIHIAQRNVCTVVIYYRMERHKQAHCRLTLHDFTVLFLNTINNIGTSIELLTDFKLSRIKIKDMLILKPFGYKL